MVIKLLSIPVSYPNECGVLRSYSGIFDGEGWEMSLSITSLVGGGYVNQFKMGD